MPENEEIIKKLYQIWLHSKQKITEFNIVFSDDKEIENLREENLPDFFDNLNELYWNYFFITVAKLLDSHTQGRNTNLTIFTLPEILKKEKIEDWKKVQNQAENLKVKHQDIIDHRRKNLAHFDFDHTIQKKKLSGSTHIDEIDDFFNEMLEIINTTRKKLSLEPYSGGFMVHGRFKGSRELLRILKSQ
ncbi:hypothetical protein C7S20_12710 [Christiangramia fulva]|uniref:HEPN AbiU2-like domain-containing protein n=1 Tax=Christiangramia fulva TaxID=2126553 RepID=A0A2R3Z6Y4_9FLAO|nr:hypothetical protein [Christiangramia fulva]AVR46046.1 hypothetical protein C7S20_12710 [Christiangramia fulva]